VLVGEMKLPDELLDNFKYAITDEDIPMLEEAYKAGMLAAADIAWPLDKDDVTPTAWGREAAANEIREAAE